MRIHRSILLICLAAFCQLAPAETRVGDVWTYAARNAYNDIQKAIYRTEVTGVSAAGIATRVTNETTQTVTNERFTRSWNPIFAEWAALRPLEFSPAYPEFPDRIESGVSWNVETMSRDPATSRQMKMEVWGKVLGAERVRVPAGEFDCIKIRRDTLLDDAEVWRGRTRVWEFEWYAPSLQRTVKYETRSEYHDNSVRNSLRRGDWTIFELTSYKTQ